MPLPSIKEGFRKAATHTYTHTLTNTHSHDSLPPKAAAAVEGVNVTTQHLLSLPLLPTPVRRRFEALSQLRWLKHRSLWFGCASEKRHFSGGSHRVSNPQRHGRTLPRRPCLEGHWARGRKSFPNSAGHQASLFSVDSLVSSVELAVGCRPGQRILDPAVPKSSRGFRLSGLPRHGPRKPFKSSCGPAWEVLPLKPFYSI